MKRVSFPVRTGFHQRLNERVSHYFEKNGLIRTGNWKMFLKTGIAFAWLISAYVLLVFFADSLVSAALLAIALGLGFVMVGFNVMHDGAHGSYSSKKYVNRIMAWSLDLIGGSQMLWRQKHNILHHTYTNIQGVDDDLDTSGLIRLSPDQKWRPWHRFQHVYSPLLYSLLTINTLLYSDFRKVFTGRIGEYQLKKPKAGEMLSFFSARALYFGYTLVLPMLFHPPLLVLTFFVLAHLVSGFIFSLVFQLAHTVEGNSFPRPDPESGFMKSEWSIHEVETTANFAPGNRWITWFCGGLNFQIEHHLLSRTCHIHYPDLSAIVRETCAEFQINYTSYTTLRSALVKHFRFLKRLGEPAN